MMEVYFSLWDEAASMFRGLLNSGDITLSVNVVTSVIPTYLEVTYIFKLKISLN